MEFSPFFTNDFGESYLYSINRDSFSRTGSDAIFLSKFGSSLFEQNHLYIICGSDSGLLAHYIDKQGIADGSCYLFVEPPELAEHINAKYNLNSVGKRVVLTSADRWQKDAKSLGIERYIHLGKVQLVKSLGAQDAFFDSYLPLWRQIKAHVDFALWETKAKTTFHEHLSIQIQNLQDNVYPSLCLKGGLPNIPAVIIAGGPSLDDALPWIQKNRAKVAVIAVSRMSRALDNANIIPDVILSIDPFVGTFEVGQEMMRFQQESLFVNGYHVYPGLLSGWSGKKVYIGPLFSWQTPNQPDNLAQAGPTVTNSAISLAIDMGCNPIILAGVDLCYSQDGYTHASGTDEHAAGPALMEGDRLVATNSGTLAETKNEFLQAGHIIEQLGGQAGAKGIKLINPAANAVKLENVDHCPLNSLELAALTTPAKDLINRVLPEDTPGTRIKHYQFVLDELRKVFKEIRAVRILAKEALECNAKLFDKTGKGSNAKFKRQNDHIEAQINSRHAAVTRYLKTFGLRYFIETIRIKSGEQWSEQEAEAYAIQYYGAYIQSSEEILSVLESAIERTRYRLEEESTQPKIEALYAFWAKDKAFLRGKVWTTEHPAHHAANRETIDILAADLQRKLDAFVTAHTTKHIEFAESTTSLDGLPGRTMEYFTNGDINSIERLARGLGRHPAREKAERLINLVNGYKHELRDEIDSALAAYRKVTNGDGFEDACIRQVVLNLRRDDHQAARNILATLWERSPYYGPYYADILKLSGEAQLALDVYTAYLQQAPDDVGTMMKMGMLYNELGVNDATRWVMEYILQKDPQNQAARQTLDTLQQAS